MKKQSNTIDAFFALLRAGLWEQGVRLSSFEPFDFAVLYELAEEQSVAGLIAAGLEHVEDRKVKKQEAMPFLKNVFSLEGQNASMNSFIADIVVKMREAGIYPLLVKGQGVAQCYTRPLWRSAGDVDFLFDAENYEKAKAFLLPMATSSEREVRYKKHLAMVFDSWVVELHGLMPTEISRRINAGIEEIQENIFGKGGIRVWKNGKVDVFLPAPDNDIILIFTHFLQHFFVGGVGLRQIADWSRLLWTYREEIDRNLLGQRLRRMGILSEWKVFAHFAVSYLGIPAGTMPFYEPSGVLSWRSRLVCSHILKTGNLGHNMDQSYRGRYPRLIGKSITLWRRIGEFFYMSLVFPLEVPRFFLTYVVRRTKAALLYNSQPKVS